MYDLTNVTAKDVSECKAALEKMGTGAQNMEAAANRIVRFFYDQFGDKQSGKTACALVRFFKTHPYQELDAELRRFADGIASREPTTPGMKCLTLLATVGARPEWNSRLTSQGHQAIPLRSEQMVEQAPMIAQLIKQMGLEITTVLKPDPSLLVGGGRQADNVFYIPKAAGSSYVVGQQEFVKPHKIESVLGFGDLLPSGNLFAIIMFSRVPIPRETADRFKELAQSAKSAVLPFEGGRVFV
jgi:hypothetical protein